jgi:hypothetical protein
MLYVVLSLLLPVQDEETTKRVEKLIKDLGSQKTAEVVSAATELAGFGPAAKAALPALRESLNAKSLEVRGHAAGALLLIDQAEAGKAMPVLREAIGEKGDPLLCLNLLNVLSNRVKPSRPETVEGFLKLAGEKDPLAWMLADMNLRRIEKGSKDLVPALEAGLKEQNVRGRVMAARCLGTVAPSKLAAAVKVLRDSLKELDLGTRLTAAADLVALDDEQIPFVIESLTPGLKDSRPYMKCRVGAYLLELDSKQADAVLPPLREMLKSADAAMTSDVLRLLVPTLHRKADRFKYLSPIYEQLASAESREVRAELLRHLAELGPVALPLEKHVRDSAKERQAEIALPAIESLMRMRPDRAASLVPQLIEWAEKRDRSARGVRDLVELLEKLKLLQQPGNDEDWGASMGEQIEQRKRREGSAWHREELLRLHSIIELAELKEKGKKGVPALMNVVKDREGAKEIVRGQAAIALGRIGRPAVSAIPTLLKVSKDETEAPDVRLAAREAMKMIDRDKEK